MNLYAFDGHNLGYRSTCAFPDLTLDGFPIGGVYGMIRILSAFVHDFSPGKIVMPFDMGKSVYRLSIHPEYKAHRRSDPRMAALGIAFRDQLTVMLDLLQQFGVTTIDQETIGWEADDVIAYLVYRFKRGDFPNVRQVLILSSDKDLCGLVQEGVVWFNPITKELINLGNFEATFGIKPEQYPDFKCLKGDASDNIPHPAGIGEKTAVKLLKEYGSVASLQAVKHSKLQGQEAVLELARKLVSLQLHHQFADDPVWGRIDAKLLVQPEISPTILDTLRGLQFDSILERWDADFPKWKAFNQSTLV